MSTVKCQKHIKHVKHIKCQMPAMSNMSKWQMQKVCKTSHDKCQMIQMSNVKCHPKSMNQPNKKTQYLQIVTISKSIHLTNPKKSIQSLVPHPKFKNMFICICLHVGFKCIWSSIVLLSNARSFLLWSSHIHNYSNSSTAHGYGTSTGSSAAHDQECLQVRPGMIVHLATRSRSIYQAASYSIF